MSGRLFFPAAFSHKRLFFFIFPPNRKSDTPRRAQETEKLWSPVSILAKGVEREDSVAYVRRHYCARPNLSDLPLTQPTGLSIRFLLLLLLLCFVNALYIIASLTLKFLNVVG